MALPLPAAVRELATSVQDRLRPYGWPVKWVDPELMHVTMKFLGNIDNVAIASIESSLTGVAERHQATNLTTGPCGAFPTLFRPRVFWLGLEGDVAALEALAADVSTTLSASGVEGDNRPFQPHITIGRLRRNEVPPAGFEEIATNLELATVEVRFDRLQLIRSVLGNSGPAYTVLSEWQLSEPAAVILPELVEHG